MRLRAVLNEGRRLQEVLRSLDRVSKMVTVLLSPTEVAFVANPNSPDSLQVWAVLAAASADGDAVFKTFRIESRNGNKIGFETDLAQFQRAIKTAENAEVATMKLSSKNGRPFITFEIIAKTGDLLMTSIQDIPVRLLEADEHNSLNEPDIGMPTVRLVVPDLRSLSNVTDRLKHLDSKIEMKVNMAGELQLGAATEFAFMTNYWRDLQPPPMHGQPQPARDPAQKASGVVDRALQKLLVWHGLPTPHLMRSSLRAFCESSPPPS